MEVSTLSCKVEGSAYPGLSTGGNGQCAIALTEQAYGLPRREEGKVVLGSRFRLKLMRAGDSVDLVEREHSHFFLWATCVECLTEILIRVPADQRETTVYILGATWRLLPGNRLREIRLCLLRL